MLSLETLRNHESVGLVVRDKDGNIKDYRYTIHLAGYSFEFIPNQRYIKLLNLGRTDILKIPFFYGQWKATKDLT